ncbi:MAG TPA: HEAT repeat domain-containing protein, partial [Methylomirabilota bacterium]|nr:HEAT repeat domain-containing protein [Methylomirabilota bacterium]
ERTEAARHAVPELKAALKDKEYWVRQAAAEVLARIGDALPAVPPAATTGEQTTFIHAADHKRQTAVDILLNALQDPDRDLRQAAAEALGRIGDRRAIVPLQAATDDPDAGVRTAATAALASLQDSPPMPQP